jgi:hypothetical protein
MEAALWIECPEMLRVGEDEHYEERQGCEACSPFWEVYAICPWCDTRLTHKGYCRKCDEEFDLDYPRIFKFPRGEIREYRVQEGVDYGRIDESE